MLTITIQHTDECDDGADRPVITHAQLNAIIAGRERTARKLDTIRHALSVIAQPYTKE